MDPKYRSKAASYDFDKYSSKGSAVHPVKKLNIHNQVMGGYVAGGPPAITDGVQGNALELVFNRKKYYMIIIMPFLRISICLLAYGGYWL